MAGTSVDETKDQSEPLKPSTEVVETPCDPWPEPYYLERGLRRVAPYYHSYKTYCKQRWRGREILDVFGSEFRDRGKEYYKSAIEEGGVTINGKVVSTDTIIKNGDLISHTLHRHEPPVTSLPIGIIHENDDMIVIDKPPGVPVHPTGRYNHNSITEIMRAECGGKFNPSPCNRLDRLTSGVMFIGKNPKGAEVVSGKLQSRSVQKEYVTRVKGKFPDGVIVCDQPVMQVSPQLSLNRARASGKEAKTKFRRIAYYPPKSQESSGSDEEEVTSNGSKAERPATPPPASESEGYSIVHCLPLTGRTHQIRVHLQFLGYPITNDPIYSNRRVFGPNLARADNTGDFDKEIIERLSKVGKTETADSGVNYSTFQAPPSPLPTGTDSSTVEAIMVKQHDEMVEDYHKRKGEKMSGKMCEECGTALYTDPGVDQLGIYLHAAAYTDLDGLWKYRSKLPSWALPPGRKLEEGDNGVPDWVDVDEGEEILFGGTQLGEDKTALVEGLGVVDISGGTEVEKESAAAASDS